MCGIFGIKIENYSFEEFLPLFKNLINTNLSRGNESLSITLVSKHHGSDVDVHIFKDLTLCFENFLLYLEESYSDFDYVLGHTRSSTNQQLSKEVQVNHPFMYQKNYVAHNGILSNESVTMLSELYEEEGHTDSWYLTRFIIDYSISCSQQLQGTFACWLWNPLIHSVFLFTNSNTIYVNDERYFTSLRNEDSDTRLNPGTLCNFTYSNSLIQFEINNPYLIL